MTQFSTVAALMMFLTKLYIYSTTFQENSSVSPLFFPLTEIIKKSKPLIKASFGSQVRQAGCKKGLNKTVELNVTDQLNSCGFMQMQSSESKDVLCH